MCQARGTGASVGRRCYQGSSSFQPTFARIGDAGGELGLELFWGTQLEVFKDLDWSFLRPLPTRRFYPEVVAGELKGVIVHIAPTSSFILKRNW